MRHALVYAWGLCRLAAVLARFGLAVARFVIVPPRVALVINGKPSGVVRIFKSRRDALAFLRPAIARVRGLASAAIKELAPC